jgi:hypothetical protein
MPQTIRQTKRRIAAKNRTTGLRDRAARRGLRAGVLRGAGLAALVRFGATSGGLRRPVVPIALPGPVVEALLYRALRRM